MPDAHAPTPSHPTDLTEPPGRAPGAVPEPGRRGGDVARQVAVVVGAVLSAVAGWLGSGAAGGPSQQEVGDGALAADATPVAPGEPAFMIWSVIYAGLFAYAVWQALPARRADERQRRVGWLVLAAMLLNAAWIGVVQGGLLVLSVPVILALLAVLLVAVARLGERRPSGVVEAVVLDGTTGLYLGWVTVATIANVFAVVIAGTDDPAAAAASTTADAWAVAALALAGVAGVASAVWTRGRLAIGAAIVWGLSWVVVARGSGDLVSLPAEVAAAVAAGAVTVATAGMAVRRLRGRARAERPSAPRGR